MEDAQELTPIVDGGALAHSGGIDFNAIMLKAVERDGTEAIREIREMKREQREADARQAFFAAMSDFRAELPPIEKTNEGQHVSWKGGKRKGGYAKKDEIEMAIRPYESRHGFAHRFNTPSGDTLECIVTHRGGHEITTTIPWMDDTPTGKNKIQAKQSGMSYGERRALVQAYGIILVDDLDDDGETHEERVVNKITDAQAKELGGLFEQLPEALARETFDALMKWAGLGEDASTADLPASKFAGAKRAVQKRIDEQKGGE